MPLSNEAAYQKAKLNAAVSRERLNKIKLNDGPQIVGTTSTHMLWTLIIFQGLRKGIQ